MWLFFSFNESFYFINGENGSFLEPKLLINFFLKSCSLGFFEIIPALKSGQKWLFWIWKGNSYYAQNGLNKSIVRTHGSFLLHTQYFPRMERSSHSSHYFFSIQYICLSNKSVASKYSKLNMLLALNFSSKIIKESFSGHF